MACDRQGRESRYTCPQRIRRMGGNGRGASTVRTEDEKGGVVTRMRFRAQAYKRGGSKRSEPNKKEARYLAFCDLRKRAGQIHSYIFGSHQFWLPGRVPYLPDVEEVQTNGEIWQIDVKATNSKTKRPLITESARNKMKQCAELFPHYRWFIAFEINGGWDVEEF